MNAFRTHGAPSWAELTTTDPQAAAAFYGDLFGWKVNPMPGGVADYHHVDTGGPDASPDGGLMKRQNPGHRHRQRAAFRRRATTGDVCGVGLSRF